jgi:hypothetical protein
MRNDRRNGVVVINIIKDTSGDAVVEATILFPIMIMIFAALVLLAIYLPSRAVLQRSTQYTATAIATTLSDTWLYFDESTMSYGWETDKNRLRGVYSFPLGGVTDAMSPGEEIVVQIEDRGISARAGTLTVDCYINNKFVYREVVVTATREFEIPLNLSFIRFPRVISIQVTSTAVVPNGDEFIRNMDLAVDFLEYINDKFELGNISNIISSYFGEVASFFGW